jgi:hypothetical protein
MRLRAKGIVALVALVIGIFGFLSPLAISQEAETRLQGTIEKLGNGVLDLKSSGGGMMSLAVNADTAVFTNEPSSLSAIKAGDYVASTTVKGEDGKFRSKQLRIFPEALRGLGDGARPMEAPDTTMINAGVSEVVAAPEGQILKVQYKDGTAEFIVDAQTSVSAIVPSEASALKSGAKVFILATKATDGHLTAKRIMATR